jgi:site-specific DNA-cytosine methylase
VAINFISNEFNTTINHIDGNKLNNSVENLEWNTDSENQNHAIEIKKMIEKKAGRLGLTSGFKESQKASTLLQRDYKGMNNWGINVVFEEESKIRRLTPLECERLQTVADNYTNHVSDSQRYKMLGNGWTVDVIAHIFSYIKTEE